MQFVINDYFSDRVELYACTVFDFQKIKRRIHMSEKNFLSACDVAQYLGVSISMAYKIIRRLNEELKQRGFITISGKISRRFFEDRVNGF